VGRACSHAAVDFMERECHEENFCDCGFGIDVGRDGGACGDDGECGDGSANGRDELEDDFSACLFGGDCGAGAVERGDSGGGGDWFDASPAEVTVSKKRRKTKDERSFG